MYHYTYLLKDKHSNMKYIGVRSCYCLPKDDTAYWGSSKHLPTDVHLTHKKRVLSIFKTRKEAVSHEIFLHEKYQVSTNPLFYNKAKQTSTGFDTSGIPLSEERKQNISNKLKGRKKPEGHGANVSASTKGIPKSLEHRLNCSKAQKRHASKPDYINPRKNVQLTDLTKQRISQSKKANGNSKGVTNPRFSPWFITINGTRYEYANKTKSDFALENGLNPDTFRSQASKSQGIKPVKCSHLGKCIIGNIV